MEAYKEVQKKYGAAVMLIGIAVWIVFYVLGMRAIGNGFLLGCLASIINFALLGLSLARRLSLRLTGRKLKVNIFSSLIFRFFIMAVAVYMGIKYPEKFNFFAVFAGLFMVQIMILIYHFKMELFPKRGE